MENENPWVILVERNESPLVQFMIEGGWSEKNYEKIVALPVSYGEINCINHVIHIKESDLERNKNIASKIMKKNGYRFLKKYLKRGYFYGKKLLKFGKELEGMRFDNKTDNELIYLMRIFVKLHHNISPFYPFTVLLGEVCEKQISNMLRKEILQEKSKNIFKYITASEKENVHAKELISLYKIGIYIEKNKIKNWKNEDKIIGMIREHRKQFQWIPCRWYFGNPWNKGDIIERLENILKEGAENKLKRLDEYYKDIKIKSKKIISRLKLNKKLIKYIKELVFFRTYRSDIVQKVGFQARHFFSEIAKRIDMQYNEIIYFIPPEIEKMLRSKKGNKKEAEQRKKEFALYCKEGIFTVISGIALNDYKKNNLSAAKEINEHNEIKGSIANNGYAKGICMIVNKFEDIAKMRKDNIMISVMTFPSLIPAMEKAAAFVTDEGGILCHAAIVSRELGKPCVIGTKIATKIFKDGDLVEVDANEGIVRKLGNK